MPKNYVYRMDHDTGFAPNTSYSICSLSGCKTTTVEKWATIGSWIIGIGGKGTGKPDKLIYAMEVEICLSYPEFKERFPQKSRYLQEVPVEKILVSSNYFYFGDKAVDIPRELEYIIIKQRGCKCISNEDVTKLKKYLQEFDADGKPNNPTLKNRRRKCYCSTHPH